MKNRVLSKISDNWQRRTKKSKRNLTTAIYGGILVVVLGVIGISYRAPLSDSVGKTQPDQNITDTNEATVVRTNTYIDQASEASLAADIAATAKLSVEGLALERAVTAALWSEVSQTEAATITKPVLLTGDDNNAIVSYTTVEGDTVSGLAAIFGVSEQTIKWANNLTSDALAAGTRLVIPSVDGVVHIVKDDDTLESIVKKYGSSISQILAINNIDDIIVGESIVLPGGELPDNERPGYTAPVVTSYFYTPSYSSYASVGDFRFLYVNSKPTSGGNRHYWGNCTWFAWEYRAEIGRPLPWGVPLGNGGSWHVSLGNMGYRVDYIPEIGAVQDSPGHVAVVVGIGDGTVTIREMNYGGRLNVVSERTMTMAQAVQYLYIH